MTVNCHDFSNILDSSIVIKDEYENKTKLLTSLSFGELIQSINNIDFLKSMLDYNQNFAKHHNRN